MRAAAAATRTSCWDPASVCINYIVLYRAVMHELCNYCGTRATLSPKTCRCNCGGKPNIANDITIRYITQSHVSSGGETITRLLSKGLVNLSHRLDFCTTDFLPAGTPPPLALVPGYVVKKSSAEIRSASQEIRFHREPHWNDSQTLSVLDSFIHRAARPALESTGPRSAHQLRVGVRNARFPAQKTRE